MYNAATNKEFRGCGKRRKVIALNLSVQAHMRRGGVIRKKAAYAIERVRVTNFPCYAIFANDTELANSTVRFLSSLGRGLNSQPVNSRLINSIRFSEFYARTFASVRIYEFIKLGA